MPSHFAVISGSFDNWWNRNDLNRQFRESYRNVLFGQYRTLTNAVDNPKARDVLGKLATGEPTGERTVKGRRVKTTYKQMTGSEGENLKDSVSQALRQAWQRFKK